MTSTTNGAIVDAADAVRAAHLDALRPLAEIAGRTVAAPPTVEAALAAALHLIAARPVLDAAVTDLLRELISAGISSTKLARLMSIRHSSLTARLDAPAPPPRSPPSCTSACSDARTGSASVPPASR
ncbi:hypothetical protein I549_0222 [Mycobacterium avium subsp. avium 2285 (R)]|nr:hypothetical protein I549_0222 [Mycobacterium avium subsp. avium 2285 (R)]